MVVGPSDTGKSLLCRLLAKQFRNAFSVAELACGRLGTRRSLYQAILYEFGQSYRDMDEGELLGTGGLSPLGQERPAGNGALGR